MPVKTWSFPCSCYRRQRFSFIGYDVLSFVQESARFFLFIKSHLCIVSSFEECTFFSSFSFEAQQQTQPDKLFGTPQVKLIGIGPAWVSLAHHFHSLIEWKLYKFFFFCKSFSFDSPYQIQPDKLLADPNSSALAYGQLQFHLHTSGWIQDLS